VSGILNVLVGTSGSERIVITVGVSGGAGYIESTGLGSISPTTFRGLLITVARSTTGFDFQVGIDNIDDQAFFSRITVEDGSGVLRSYASADATYVGDAGGSTWVWGDGSDRVFETADNAEEHPLTFHL
jgi:hypothetical protein